MGGAQTRVRPAPLGADGKPMSVWQVWLKRLCVVMIVWAVLELVFGAAFWAVGSVADGVRVAGVELRDIAAAVGATALVSAVFNLAIGLLGIRGAKNPYKITLFFWITLADAVPVSYTHLDVYKRQPSTTMVTCSFSAMPTTPSRMARLRSPCARGRYAARRAT